MLLSPITEGDSMTMKTRWFLYLCLAVLLFAVQACAKHDNPIEQAQNALKAEKYDQALALVRPLALQGDPEGEYLLGIMCYMGWGLPNDTAEGLKWIRKAADQGDRRAEFSLGGFYRDGKMVPQNYGEALKWFQKAAKQDVPGALLALGNMYANGEGVKKDPVEAYKWHTLAHAHGMGRASLDVFDRTLIPAQIAEAKRRASEFNSDREKIPKADEIGKTKTGK